MLRLEVLDSNDRVLAAHKVSEGLTLLGKSPGAHIHLSGKGVGALHVAIKNPKDGAKPVIMDLGGPTPLKVNGKETLEQELELSDKTRSAVVEIGSRRIRVTRLGVALQDIRSTPWQPLVNRESDKKGGAVIRIRAYIKGRPEEVINTREGLILHTRYGVAEAHKAIWLKGKSAFLQLPADWLKLGGRVQIGKDKITKLEDFAAATQLEQNTIYRIFAGPYMLEVLVGEGLAVAPAAKLDMFPKELRKPFAISAGSVLLMVGLWLLMIARSETKVEEPYTTYARIQNIPVEKLPEPEQTAAENLPQAGGGTGSESKQTTAPTIGQAASAPSKLAAALTGGLKSLVGSVVSQSKTSNAVVSETGVGVAAAAGSPGPSVGKLSSVGNGSSAVAGAAKLGNLNIAGSGKGFGGGSGMGLGAGLGNGIGNGVGNGIGRGGFRLVEEESIVDGGLDKSVIAAVIQNNLAQIKYCYERQLVADPDLFGKVVVSWVINAAGGVEATTVKQTTLNSSPVEQCMLAKIAGWKFPQPKNGTKVNVVYPFLFKSTK